MEEKLTGMEWKRNGNGMESKRKMEQRQKEKVCYRNEQKSKRTDLKQNKFIQKWNGNGMEREWKWNGKISTNDIDAKWNGNGTEMEWKWNGKKLLHQLGIKVKQSGMETEWKWNGETIATSDRKN